MRISDFDLCYSTQTKCPFSWFISGFVVVFFLFFVTHLFCPFKWNYISSGERF